MLVYGKAGSGKSVFASTFPKPLIFDFDSGHKIYENQKLFLEAKYVRQESLKNGSLLGALALAIKQIKEGTNKFETIVIDSLTNLENTAISRMKGTNSENWDQNLYNSRGKKLDFTDWGNISGSSIALLTELRQYPINIIVITQVSTYSDSGTEKYKPELVGKGQDESLHYPDFVMFMEKHEEGRFGYLSSTDQDRFVAKARLGVSEIKPIKNPNYAKMKALIESSKAALDFS